MLESSILLGVPSAVFSSDDGITPILNLKDLYEHNAIEHDASIVRQDDFFEPLGQFDSTLFERLIDNSKNSNNDQKNDNGNSSGGWISTQDLLGYQRERILHSRKNNPEHSFNHHDGFVQSTIGSEKLLFLLLGGDLNLKRMDVNYLESFLKEGRIPDNFEPRIDMGLDAIHFSESPYSEMLLNFSLRIKAAVEYEPLLEEEEGSSSITTNFPSPSMAPSTAIPTNNVDGTSSAGMLFPVMMLLLSYYVLSSSQF